MDDVFSEFLQTFGNVAVRREVPASTIAKYAGKLPRLLLEHWKEHGWGGYGDGIFWFVNPQEYEGVVASWLEGSELECRDRYHLIARGAFGSLYLWGEASCETVKITASLSRYSIYESQLDREQGDKAFQYFLLSMDPEYNDVDHLFKKARKKLGALLPDEMYGFAPALMLGGSGSLASVEKVKAVEHLMLLSQLTTLESYNFPEL